jgi:chemotaxis protein histidine kinase CheA
MYSDESNTRGQEQEQELALEAFDDGQQKQAAKVSDDVNKSSQTEKLVTEQPEESAAAALTQTVAELKRQEQELREKIAVLQETQNQLLQDQLAKTRDAMEQLVQQGLSELEQRKQALQISIEQLERRRERIRAEMRTTFAGVSQDLAIRVQGFKDYLVGSLQDLASAAEQLDLAPSPELTQREAEEYREPEKAPTPKFTEQGFQEQARQIRNILDQYRTLPDYYGPPWQLRRTFEPIHAERVSNWFFSQGGRGAIKTMGSRLQNILVGSAVVSVSRTLYGDRLRALILANTPERLGEWRRGLQDCLGVSRADFGPERGITLFEEPFALVQKAERLIDQKQLPLIIVDETEDQISLSLLQFPLWLAFASDPQQMSTYQY